MDLEHAKRWRKALGDEEFRAKFPQEAIKLSVEDAIEQLKSDDLPPLGPVGNGLYHIGGGAYTGKKGWDKFELELKKNINKWHTQH